MKLNEQAKKLLQERTDLELITDRQKELSYEHKSGRQLAVIMESKTALRVWIEAKSESEYANRANYKYYPSTKSRAHMTAKRLTQGKSAWYVKFESLEDFKNMLNEYWDNTTTNSV